jgi:hypothetical protein
MQGLYCVRRLISAVFFLNRLTDARCVSSALNSMLLSPGARCPVWNTLSYSLFLSWAKGKLRLGV